jgi:predicted nucleic acid-binding protein
LVDTRPTLIRAAGEVAEHYRLRAYDAIHLASALSLEKGDLVLATWDADLRRAAGDVGLAVAP